MTANVECLAVVTGTSSGIGAAVARELLQAGWTVVGIARRAARFGSSAYRHLAVDLSDPQQLAATTEEELAPLLAEPGWQRVGLVNNAATAGDLRPLERHDARSLSQAFAINTVAPMVLMGLALRAVPPSTWLRIVNVSTGAAVRPLPGLSDYGSSKAALRMAGMILAEELTSPRRPGGTRPKTAILSYSPGVVDTAMQEQARRPGRAWNQPFVDFHAQGMLQPPEAPAAEIVQFLAGEDGAAFAEARLGEGR